MCRLLGIVTASPYEFGLVLREAPRSLAILSREHRDGWGVATHPGGGDGDGGWVVHRSVETADDDPAFAEQARRARGRVLVAHVRQKTVGPLSLANTHPFRRGAWVFAHNGTVADVGWLARNAAPSRLAEREGVTDSELFFAYLLTRLDEGGSGAIDQVIDRAVRTATGRAGFGSLDFVLSNGSCLWVGRFGRPLHLLERTPGAPAPRDDDGVVPVGRRHCIAVASEQLTDEAWTAVPQGVLLRLDVTPFPTWRTVSSTGGSHPNERS